LASIHLKSNAYLYEDRHLLQNSQCIVMYTGSECVKIPSSIYTTPWQALIAFKCSHTFYTIPTEVTAIKM